jgi:hypothetical protein
MEMRYKYEGPNLDGSKDRADDRTECVKMQDAKGPAAEAEGLESNAVDKYHEPSMSVTKLNIAC